jgi:hypothetical protein
MSKVMLLGVLRMPPELWVNDSLIDIQQRYSRYLEAADLLDRKKEDCKFHVFRYCGHIKPCKNGCKPIFECKFEYETKEEQCPCNNFEKKEKENMPLHCIEEETEKITLSFDVGDIIRVQIPKGSYRVWKITGIFLGIGYQESFVTLKTLDFKEASEELRVPYVFLKFCEKIK